MGEVEVSHFVDLVKRALDYDPDTGRMTWRVRDDVPASWNTRYAGKPAGRIARNGYHEVAIGARLYGAHRLAWAIVHGEMPSAQIDHINRDPSDNRLVNLRAATQVENCQNTGKHSNNTSGFKGVHQHSGRWQARIRVNGRRLWLGYFETAEEAGDAYERAAREHHGRFARP
jgi:hypothetical protein